MSSLKYVAYILLAFSFFATVNLHNPNDINFYCNKNESNTLSIIGVGVISAIVFALVGILPSLFIRTDADEAKFVAAGSLLAEVFLHLLPETMEGVTQQQAIKNGLNSIVSFFIFLTIEKFTELVPNAHALGTLNLIANFVDNSAHGTTVVGAFQNSIKFGLVALLATIIHEVPHEFSDFALLLRDGYTRKRAVLAQLITSFAGTIGATIAYALTANDLKNQCLSFKDSSSANTEQSHLLNSHLSHHHHHHLSHHPPNHTHGSFILPFTIGGFLYIALVGIIPEIIEEKDHKTSFLQIVSFLVGVIFIYSLTQIEAILPFLFL